MKLKFSRLKFSSLMAFGTVTTLLMFSGISTAIASASNSAPVFGITKAQVGPSSTAIGQTVHASGQIYNTGNNVSPVIIDFEIHDASNNKVYQKFYTGQSLPNQGRYNVNESYTPSASGNYVFQYGVFSNDWSKTYQYGNIGSFAVTPSSVSASPAFGITKVSASPQSLTVGQTNYINGTVYNNGGNSSPVIVDFEVHDAQNNKVFQKFYTDQNFPSQAQIGYNGIAWTPNVIGKYSIQYGVFTNDWSKNYVYNSAIAQLTVTAPASSQHTNPPIFSPASSPVPMPTPTPPTSVDTSTYSGYGFQVTPTQITTTISKAIAQKCSGQLLCSDKGVTIKNISSPCYGFDFNESIHDNVAFYYNSGGVVTSNGPLFDPIGVSPSLPNGIYTGTLQLQLCTSAGTDSYMNGPAIKYTINVTD